MYVLGIETSCDETAAAVVQWERPSNDEPLKGIICSNSVYSQLDDHADFGGVVPEIAARAHAKKIDTIIHAAMAEARCKLQQIDAIAATAGPGLAGGLMVGLTTAKALSAASGKPLYAINHLEGHALTARLTDGLEFPYILLLVSGGHTQILWISGVGQYRKLGTTIDDALGEAFDKTAKLLGLPYPGGPEVEKAALHGNKSRFQLPKPMIGKAGCDFSFSGLKTAVRHLAEKQAPLTDQDVADICAVFQETIGAILQERLLHAYQIIGEDYSGSMPPLVIAGGVAANHVLREKIESTTHQLGTKLIAPPMNLCTDNAAMIAWAAAERIHAGFSPVGLDFPIRSRWPLDENAAPQIGHGKRGVKV